MFYLHPKPALAFIPKEKPIIKFIIFGNQNKFLFGEQNREALLVLLLFSMPVYENVDSGFIN